MAVLEMPNSISFMAKLWFLFRFLHNWQIIFDKKIDFVL
jgi:hypothetical protein